MPKIQGWSIKYKKCASCGGTEQPHKARGLCNTCFFRDYRKKNPKIHKKAAYKYNKRNKAEIKKRKVYALYGKRNKQESEGE